MSGPTKDDIKRWASESNLDIMPGCLESDWSAQNLARFAQLAYAAGQANTPQNHIDALVGDRLTAQKAAHILERDGYVVTGVVMTLPDGRACIVNRSAVRWLHGKDDLFNLLHTDTALNQRLINEAVIAEREACADICDVHANGWESNPGNNPMAGFISANNCAYAIRARGDK